MRRRINLTMVAMVAGALVLAGLGTLGLSALDSVSETQAALVTQAQQLAHGVQQEVAASKTRERPTVLRTAIALLKSPLRLQGDAVVAVTPDGDLCNFLGPAGPVALPSRLPLNQVDTAQLILGQPVSGHRGRLAWAAYLFSTDVPVANATACGSRFGVVNLVVILTREAPAIPTRAAEWFGVAAAATLVVALIAATRLARRIAHPLQDAEEVTGRIAAGDLAARVPLPRHEGRELVSLADSVNQMAAELQRAQGAQRQFLMSVSHDLRTPLTSIRGFAEAIADETADDVGRAVAIIGTEACRLERLVGDLLELAKLDSGAFSLRLTPLDASTVTEDAAHAFAPQAAELGLSLSVRPAPPGLAMCEADPDRLGQVIANLVENALKYARTSVAVTVEGRAAEVDEAGNRPPGGRRQRGTASARQQGRGTTGILITVEDDGPGIPEEDLPRIFERLFRSSTVAIRSLGGGSGLGLSIVAELVKAMGGSVHAESPVGPHGGTRMVITLGRPRAGPSTSPPPQARSRAENLPLAPA
ncbi:MAG TPA: HAMP domain-containing sensor histidine kinase [Acidimicrobiales bacterium]|nr:HAMP domain-containing sensor histidine kinase [Acidimicrobiales bacterium]